MKTPMRVALAGVGQRGLQHLKALTSPPLRELAQITALIDVNEENLRAEKIARYAPALDISRAARFTNVRDALKSSRFDALYIAIPPSMHQGEVAAAAEAGVHLFVEKPMSLRIEEAEEMRRAIDKAGVVSAVGFQQRYAPANEAVHNFLADKRVVMMTAIHNGALEHHSVKHTAAEREGGPKNRVWAANRAWSGTTVVEAGIHQVDLMRYWAGDIAWAEATYIHRDEGDIKDGADNPYAYRVALGFESGAAGNLILSRLRRTYYSDSYSSVLWTNGHIKFEADGAAAYCYDGDDPPSARPSIESLRRLLPSPPPCDPTVEIHRSFLMAAAAGDSSGVRSTFGGSMNSLAAVLGANLSDERGGERVWL